MNAIARLKDYWPFLILFFLIFGFITRNFGVIGLAGSASACLALLLLFLAILKSNTVALTIIFTFAFTQGVLLFLGIPTIVPRSIMELSALILLAKALYLRGIVYRKAIKTFGCLPMLGLFIVSLLSFYINEQPLLPFLLFCRHVLIFYLLFVALLNLDLSEETVKKTNRYLVFLFLIQIPAAFVKFMLIGLQEGQGVGTVSVQGGSLSTTLPLFAIAFLLSFYIFERNKMYILLIAGFIAFGLLGEKRAIVFFTPVLMLFIYFIHRKGTFYRLSGVQMKVIISIMLISLLGLYAAARTQHSLNPESEIGGSFDIRYMLDTVINSETKMTPQGYSFGRLASTVHTYNILKSEGPATLLAGIGPGFLIESSLTGQNMREAFERLGIIAGLTGLVWLTIQAGVLGGLFLLIFYLQLLRKAYIIYKGISDPYRKAMTLGFLGTSFVFILDFLAYSTSTLTAGVLSPVFYYVAAICLCTRRS